MKKIRLAIIFISILFLFGCQTTGGMSGDEVPELVKNIQHKIDKALESNPSYSDLIEIQNDYDELLIAEQEQVRDFDKIQTMINDYKRNASDSESYKYAEEAVGILQKRVKHQNTLDIKKISYSIYKSSYTYKVVYIEYFADNDLGGNVAGEAYYCIYEPGDAFGEVWGGKNLLTNSDKSDAGLAETTFSLYGTYYDKGDKEDVDVQIVLDNL